MQRNRLRRRLREAVADLGRCGGLTPGAYLLSAGPAAADLSHEELRNLVKDTLEAVAVGPV